MCSSDAQRVAEIGRAIDDLAAQARDARGTGLASDHEGIATQLAELWSRIAELDPEIARRMPTYRLD